MRRLSVVLAALLFTPPAVSAQSLGLTVTQAEYEGLCLGLKYDEVFRVIDVLDYWTFQHTGAVDYTEAGDTSEFIWRGGSGSDMVFATLVDDHLAKLTHTRLPAATECGSDYVPFTPAPITEVATTDSQEIERYVIDPCFLITAIYQDLDTSFGMTQAVTSMKDGMPSALPDAVTSLAPELRGESIERRKAIYAFALRNCLEGGVLGSEFSDVAPGDLETWDIVTEDEFARLQEGMTYEQVVGIIGVEGTVLSGPLDDSDTFFLYAWANESSSVSAGFEDGVMIFKKQLGQWPD